METLIPECPICMLRNVTAGHMLGHEARGKSSKRKARASRRNGKLGGRPCIRKDTDKISVA